MVIARLTSSSAAKAMVCYVNLFLTRLNDGTRLTILLIGIGVVSLALLYRHSLFKAFDSEFGEVFDFPRKSWLLSFLAFIFKKIEHVP